jgi:hypothetical protein
VPVAGVGAQTDVASDDQVGEGGVDVRDGRHDRVLGAGACRPHSVLPTGCIGSKL